nr:MAG TPA: hypothetical protein [Caudoviricetes sp.]
MKQTSPSACSTNSSTRNSKPSAPRQGTAIPPLRRLRPDPTQRLPLRQGRDQEGARRSRG